MGIYLPNPARSWRTYHPGGWVFRHRSQEQRNADKEIGKETRASVGLTSVQECVATSTYPSISQMFPRHTSSLNESPFILNAHGLECSITEKAVFVKIPENDTSEFREFGLGFVYPLGFDEYWITEFMGRFGWMMFLWV